MRHDFEPKIDAIFPELSPTFQRMIIVWIQTNAPESLLYQLVWNQYLVMDFWTYLSCPVVHTRPECLSSQRQMICHIHRINKQQIRYADPSNHVATLKMESFLECLGQSLVQILGLTESSSRSLGRSRHELNSASFCHQVYSIWNTFPSFPV